MQATFFLVDFEWLQSSNFSVSGTNPSLGWQRGKWENDKASFDFWPVVARFLARCRVGIWVGGVLSKVCVECVSVYVDKRTTQAVLRL